MSRRSVSLPLTIFAVAALSLSAANAQSVSGVSGADVKAGDDSIEYRTAFSFEDDGRAEAFAHRFSYQHAFDDSWRAKLVVLQSERGGSALKTRSVSIEILKQFLESEDTGGWDSAIRVDGLIPTEDNRPGRARVAWLNSIDLNDQWQVRGNVYVGKEIGDLAKDGLTLETREEATYKLASGVRIGAQMFNSYNTTAHLGSFSTQKHTLGPVVKGKIGGVVKYELSALFGLSRAASDADLRLFLGYSF